ncbi:hypothetical protein V7S57_18640 [Caulobacter sp. CCNWLY153]|uniref:Uncharacterized protein n=1 Tax=Caulobacter radicis TaxID=2172650 RepID=A0A2T9IZZ1_9CAUL|nr:hypothetical protein [Caulobacter radicis]PVM73008.1 hypothetical protein DDF65_21905 [Caulobacter radicis]
MSHPKTIDERPPRLSRDLRLLALSEALRRYAVRLQPDVNAAGLLAHRALAAAFARPVSPGGEAAGAMEAGLRDHVDRNLVDDGAKASSRSAAPHDRS